MRVRDLTGGERLLVERRRTSPPQSQRAAAVERGVSLRRYRRWEADEEDVPDEIRSIRLRKGVRPLKELDPHEECFLRRRRAGISVKEMARTLGVSRWWLIQMERGKVGSSRLIDYWEDRARPWRPRLPSGRAEACQMQGSR